MLPPQSAHGYPLAGFRPSPDQALDVPVGIPADVAAVYGPVAYGANAVPGAHVAHVGSAVRGHAPVGTTIMGGTHVINTPPQASYKNNPALVDQAQQGSFAPSSGYSQGPSRIELSGQGQQHRPSSPPPSSFPPGFEPRQNISITTGIPARPNPSVCAQGGSITHVNQHQVYVQQPDEFQRQHQQENDPEFQYQGPPSSQTLHQQQHQSGHQAPRFAQHQRQRQHKRQHRRQHQHQHQHQPEQEHQQHHQPFQSPHSAQNQLQQHNYPHQAQYESQIQHQQQQFSGQKNLQHQHQHEQEHQQQHQSVQSPRSAQNQLQQHNLPRRQAQYEYQIQHQQQFSGQKNLQHQHQHEQKHQQHHQPFQPPRPAQNQLQQHDFPHQAQYESQIQHQQQFSGQKNLQHQHQHQHEQEHQHYHQPFQSPRPAQNHLQQRNLTHQAQYESQIQHQQQFSVQKNLQHQHEQEHQQQHQPFQSPLHAQNQFQQHNVPHQAQYESQIQHHQQFSGQKTLQHHYRYQEHYEYEQPQCQHSRSQAQRFSESHSPKSQQSNPHSQLQSQPHIICKQGQRPVHSHQQSFQSCATNGVAIGVPVTPIHPNVDAMRTQNVNQMENISLNLQEHVDNYSAVVVPQGEVCQNSKISSKLYREGELCTKGLSEQTKSIAVYTPNSHAVLEGMRSHETPRFERTQVNEHSESGSAYPISPSENSHRNWRMPRQGQMRGGNSPGNPSRAFKNYQSHSNGPSKFHSNQRVTGFREKVDDGQRGLQPQKADFKGKAFSKGFATRPDRLPSRCEPCDRTFATSEVLVHHLKSHVKCGEEGCFFEATGKIVKEHRVVEHGKVEFQSTSRGLKALALRSMEDKEDINRWREERKRSYPTAGNILRKAEEKRKRKAEGESSDIDAQLRQQRMMDIIAKQKQLGYPVPEIPSHYFGGRRSRQPKKSRHDNNVGPHTVQQDNLQTRTFENDNENANHANCNDKIKEAENDAMDKQDTEAPLHDLANADDNQGRNGHFKKARHKKFPSRRDRRKPYQNSPSIPPWQKSSPSLLFKLLSKDIEAENSCIMQCCRFIVNNGFLQGCSLTSLKHFKWTEGSFKTADGVDSFGANVTDSKSALKVHKRKEASASNANSSAWAEDSYEAPDAKDPKAILKELTSSEMSGLVKDGKPHEIEQVSKESSRSKEPDEHQSCLSDGFEKIISNAGSNMQSEVNEIPSACVTLNSTGDCMSICDEQAAMKSRMEFPPQSLDAGKAASDNSGSVVDNEDDISQYINLDVSVEDSGCCC